MLAPREESVPRSGDAVPGHVDGRNDRGRPPRSIALSIALLICALFVPVGASGAAASTAAVTDPLAPPTSPDRGTHCAASLDAASLDEFFSKPIGSFGGADYQRAVRLADDRVLWTFQDAFIDGVLVHNAAMIQSGRCFTPLGGTRSWLFSDDTDHMSRWH